MKIRNRFFHAIMIFTVIVFFYSISLPATGFPHRIEFIKNFNGFLNSYEGKLTIGLPSPIVISKKTFPLAKKKNVKVVDEKDIYITLNDSTLNAVSDSEGKLTVLGTCTNNGSTPVVYVKITAMFYDSKNNVVGSGSVYLNGGTNVKLVGTDTFTNAIKGGETGFFKLVTDYPYLLVSKILFNISYDYYSVSDCNAKISLDGIPVLTSEESHLLIYGGVKNTVSNYTVYFARVFFAIFDKTGKMIDLGSEYVKGYDFDYGTGTTDTTVYGNETATFTVSFSTTYSQADRYLCSIEWKELQSTVTPEKYPPFGALETPTGAETVSGSIPITGWALDDKGVSEVKLYFERNGVETFIGNAEFVEGARPDIAAAYSSYPNSTSAGWGYMLLTNMLPNGGNGVFTIHADAIDLAKKTTRIGSQTVYCDNLHSVKPFGAIDTPTQGITASGKSYVNSGWALTPQPKIINPDGSSIWVYVDSVGIGHPVYNQYRPDIAALFPNYLNVSGASGYYFLDTTKYLNGVHTIQWTVQDSDGVMEGIGSKYFTINNFSSRLAADSSNSSKEELGKHSFLLSKVDTIREDKEPIGLMRGFEDGKQNSELEEIASNGELPVRIDINVLERIRIHFDKSASNRHYEGYQITGEELKPLPLGSTLDDKNGIFYWMPGPGFRGTFRLVFFIKRAIKSVENSDEVVLIKKTIDIVVN